MTFLIRNLIMGKEILMNKHKISSRFYGNDVEHELIILMFAKVKKRLKTDSKIV